MWDQTLTTSCRVSCVLAPAAYACLGRQIIRKRISSRKNVLEGSKSHKHTEFYQPFSDECTELPIFAGLFLVAGFDQKRNTLCEVQKLINSSCQPVVNWQWALWEGCCAHLFHLKVFLLKTLMCFSFRDPSSLEVSEHGTGSLAQVQLCSSVPGTK